MTTLPTAPWPLASTLLIAVDTSVVRGLRTKFHKTSAQLLS
jgi:hypothetical protein